MQSLSGWQEKPGSGKVKTGLDVTIADESGDGHHIDGPVENIASEDSGQVRQFVGEGKSTTSGCGVEVTIAETRSS